MLVYINIYTAIQEHMSEVCRTQTQNPSERTGSFAGIHSRGVPSVTYSCTTSTTIRILVLLIPTVLWYMYESVLQYQYWLTDFAVCRYIPSVYSICACASLHAHCK